jgi:ribonuclease HII
LGLRRYYIKGQLEAGCDEAGRGCLAGPVFAAAVILDHSRPIKELRFEIEEKALSFGVAMLTNRIIDQFNILRASFMAMHEALDKLTHEPELLLIDGNRFIPYKKIKHECIIKGDGKFQSIAAASILAKTYRDEYMCKMHDRYPQYGWDHNKGYPTTMHREAIRNHGPTELHRLTFNLLNDQLELEL